MNPIEIEDDIRKLEATGLKFHGNPEIPAAPQAPQEIWVCGHTRKCGWSGTKDETSLRTVSPRVSEHVCPKCGFNEFWMRKPKTVAEPANEKS